MGESDKQANDENWDGWDEGEEEEGGDDDWWDGSPFIGVRSFGRPEKALATLKLLETALTANDLENTYLFLEDVTSYDKVLAGTPWADRVRQGRKGADNQVNAIAEAAGIGNNAVILDDNIDYFMQFEAKDGSKLKKTRLQEPGYLSAVIAEGFAAINEGNTGIWGLCQHSNVQKMPDPLVWSFYRVCGQSLGSGFRV